ncbi:hypothetical protein L226DRAFT_338804 [Lentinus tigrinus ALCF2SS1-7]|uniref:Uncharacterized protein n=1 Tax=Lentinus tigrinus ALCF2SS1-6 TaxID=1328759 RepID=A0A5C2SG98_9APHY|nr:hypothetical protein L227DRAFT_29426 [Lentinus tigrinus ALCF2SS1-6]RPD77999.1 hypothetical protein L226DRAFT_338804 [Lentinus tigrinus ALCF2SS1-7]
MFTYPPSLLPASTYCVPLTTRYFFLGIRHKLFVPRPPRVRRPSARYPCPVSPDTPGLPLKPVRVHACSSRLYLTRRRTPDQRQLPPPPPTVPDRPLIAIAPASPTARRCDGCVRTMASGTPNPSLSPMQHARAAYNGNMLRLRASQPQPGCAGCLGLVSRVSRYSCSLSRLPLPQTQSSLARSVRLTASPHADGELPRSAFARARARARARVRSEFRVRPSPPWSWLVETPRYPGIRYPLPDVGSPLTLPGPMPRTAWTAGCRSWRCVPCSVLLRASVRGRIYARPPVCVCVCHTPCPCRLSHPHPKSLPLPRSGLVRTHSPSPPIRSSPLFLAPPYAVRHSPPFVSPHSSHCACLETRAAQLVVQRGSASSHSFVPPGGVVFIIMLACLSPCVSVVLVEKYYYAAAYV